MLVLLELLIFQMLHSLNNSLSVHAHGATTSIQLKWVCGCNHAKCNAWFIFFFFSSLCLFLSRSFPCWWYFGIYSSDCHEPFCQPNGFNTHLYHNRISKYHPNETIVFCYVFLCLFVFGCMKRNVRVSHETLNVYCMSSILWSKLFHPPFSFCFFSVVVVVILSLILFIYSSVWLFVCFSALFRLFGHTHTHNLNECNTANQPISFHCSNQLNVWDRFLSHLLLFLLWSLTKSDNAPCTTEKWQEVYFVCLTQIGRESIDNWITSEYHLF